MLEERQCITCHFASDARKIDHCLLLDVSNSGHLHAPLSREHQREGQAWAVPEAHVRDDALCGREVRDEHHEDQFAVAGRGLNVHAGRRQRVARAFEERGVEAQRLAP